MQEFSNMMVVLNEINFEEVNESNIAMLLPDFYPFQRNFQASTQHFKTGTSSYSSNSNAYFKVPCSKLAHALLVLQNPLAVCHQFQLFKLAGYSSSHLFSGVHIDTNPTKSPSLRLERKELVWVLNLVSAVQDAALPYLIRLNYEPKISQHCDIERIRTKISLYLCQMCKPPYCTSFIHPLIHILALPLQILQQVSPILHAHEAHSANQSTDISIVLPTSDHPFPLSANATSDGHSNRVLHTAVITDQGKGKFYFVLGVKFNENKDDIGDNIKLPICVEWEEVDDALTQYVFVYTVKDTAGNISDWAPKKCSGVGFQDGKLLFVIYYSLLAKSIKHYCLCVLFFFVGGLHKKK